MKIKRLALSVVTLIAPIAFTSARVARAQTADEPLPFTSYPFASLREALFRGVSLTPQQTDQAFVVTKAMLDEMDAQNTKLKAAPDSIKRAKMEERSVEHVAALRKVLTDLQRPRFDSNYTTWKARRSARGR